MPIIQSGKTRRLKPKVKPLVRSGPRVMQWRKERGINRVTFSRIANCSERKMATYEKSANLPPPVSRQLTEGLRLLEALSEIISEGELKSWLEAPNLGFAGQRPLDVIAEGQSDLIWEMIHQTRTYA